MAELSSEAVLIGGAGRAILLQLAHPAVARGVARSTGFFDDPAARLRNTLVYVYAIGCGTPDDLRRAVARVNGAHRAVRGAAEGNHPAFDATDPRLQLWVAATLWDTAVRVQQIAFGPLPPDTADRIYAEWPIVGTALQMPPELWPPDRGAFAAYFRSESERLLVTDDARAVANALMFPAEAPLWLRLILPIGRLATAGMLSPQLRAAFDLPWGPRRERRFRLLLVATRVLYPLLPDGIRYWPRDYCLAVLRGERRPRPTTAR